MVGAPSFSQPDLCIQPTLQSQPRNSFSTSANSHLRIPLLFTKSSLQSPLILPVSIPQQFFTSLCAQPSQQFTPKMFYLPQSFRQFRLRQQTRELGSLLRTDTVLISLFFVQVWAVITGLTITNSLSHRFRKFIHCSCGKPSNPLSLVLSTYCHYFHILLIPPRELIFPCKPVA